MELHLFMTFMNAIQLCFNASDGFQGSLSFWHDNLAEVVLIEFVINGQLIGTVHDLVEVAAEP